MARRPKKHLILRLFMSYLWVTIAVVVCVGAYGAHVVRTAYLQRTAEDLETLSRLCATEIADPLAAGDTEAIEDLCRKWGKSIGTRLTVIRSSGEVVADTDADPRRMDNHGDRPEIKEALSGKGPPVASSTRYSHTLREERMYVAVAVPNGPDDKVVIRASVRVTAIRATLVGLYHQIFMVGLMAMALIAVVSVWLSWRIVRPLHEIRTGVARFAQGDLDYRVPESDSEEISAVSEAINEMAEKLDQRLHAAAK